MQSLTGYYYTVWFELSQTSAKKKGYLSNQAGICLIFVMDTGNLQPLYQWIIRGNSRITIYDQ